MAKKNILKVLGVLLVVAGSLNLIVNTMIDSYTPKEIDDLISRSKTDEKLLEKLENMKKTGSATTTDIMTWEWNHLSRLLFSATRQPLFFVEN